MKIAFRDHHSGGPRGTLPDSAFEPTQADRVELLRAKLANYQPGTSGYLAVSAELDAETTRAGMGSTA
jgi:hypothetical protein